MATQIKKIMNLHDQSGVLDILNKFIFSGNPLNEYDDDTQYIAGDMIIRIDSNKQYDVYTCIRNTSGVFNINDWLVTDINTLIRQSDEISNSILDDMTQAINNAGLVDMGDYCKYKSFVYKSAQDEMVKGVKTDGFIFF